MYNQIRQKTPERYTSIEIYQRAPNGDNIYIMCRPESFEDRGEKGLLKLLLPVLYSLEEYRQHLEKATLPESSDNIQFLPDELPEMIGEIEHYSEEG